MTNKTSTKYRVHGADVLPFTHQEGSVVDKVPAGYYKVSFHPMIGYYLTKDSDAVLLPPTIFGSAQERSDRIFKNYSKSNAALGVGLFGKKGAGKSLLSALIAQRTIDEGRPVIDVSDSFTTEADYLAFLNSIAECTIIFDEFLKHISKLSAEKLTGDDVSGSRRSHNRHETAIDRQDEMLNFFQGTNTNKRLIILIDNNMHMLSEFLTDRPGRMRYKYVYEGVEREVVEQLCKHHKLTTAQTEQAIVYATRYHVSFDVINEILREWSDYPEETLEAITSILNVPSLHPEIQQKAKVISFSNNEEGTQLTLSNELCEVKSDGIIVKVKLPNPMLGEKFEDDDDFYASKYGNEHSWDMYVKYKDEAFIEKKVAFRNNNLVGIKGNRFAYANKEASVTIEILEEISSRSSSSWNMDI